MELRDLDYFAVVADELHFGRAAERLHIVPAAVSQRVRALEHELGVTLFERTSRRVALSDAGAALLPGARRVLASAREVLDTAAALRDGHLGRVRVGFAPGSAHLIDELQRLVAARDDRVVLVAESMWSHGALAGLASGDLALALVRDPLPATGIEAREVGDYRDDHVALAEGDPLAAGETVGIGSFDGRGFLLNERDTAPGVHDATVRFFAEHGVAPVWHHHRLHEHEQQLALVAAGAGAALVHSHRAGLRVPGVVIRPLREPGPRHAFHLVRPAEGASAAARRVFDLAAEIVHRR